MNKLEYIDDFANVLSGYQLSDSAKELLGQIRLALLIGPSSSGRNTIINELVKSGGYHYIVSDTTRKPRENNGVLEQNGREYWFRSEIDVLRDLQAGQFLEAAIIHNQQVSGISIRELATAANEGRVAINEIEVVGADSIHAAKPDATFLFILPPSFDEWMVRMDTRGQLPEAEVRRRMESAVFEIETALERDFYTFVINDTFVHTARRVNEFIMNGAISDQTQDEAIAVAQQLLADTRAHLAK